MACILNFVTLSLHEMKCSRDSEIRHEIVRVASRKSEKHELIPASSLTTVFRIVSRNPRYT